MDVSGKIIAVLPEQGGTSKMGNEWKKQEFVLETHDQYPKKVCFQIFGADKIQQAGIQLGEEVRVYFDIDSREYQGRWYTNISAWKVERPAQDGMGGGMPGMENQVSVGFAAPASPDFPSPNPVDDLPF